MSSRATAAADLRSRIAGNLAASASGDGPEPPRSVIAGVQALPQTPESGVGTLARPEDVASASAADPEVTAVAPAPPAPTVEKPPAAPVAAATTAPIATAAAPAASPPAPLPVVPAAPAAAPAAASGKGWDKLSITLSRADFGILETQTGQARAAGIKMRRGGNPSVFLRAALRNLEALRLTNPTAWLELVRGAASSDSL